MAHFQDANCCAYTPILGALLFRPIWHTLEHAGYINAAFFSWLVEGLSSAKT